MVTGFPESSKSITEIHPPIQPLKERVGLRPIIQPREFVFTHLPNVQ
jgi:hypothetical protein